MSPQGSICRASDSTAPPCNGVSHGATGDIWGPHHGKCPSIHQGHRSPSLSSDRQSRKDRACGILRDVRAWATSPVYHKNDV